MGILSGSPIYYWPDDPMVYRPEPKKPEVKVGQVWDAYNAAWERLSKARGII